jgi:hemin uptake protein HemP
MTDSTNPPSADPKPEGATPEPPSYASSELFQGGRVVVINHAGEAYRLLVTRNNRLILQK